MASKTRRKKPPRKTVRKAGGGPIVGVVMGSDSDWPIMSAAAEALGEFGIAHEIGVVSAHRMPEEMVEYGRSAEARGLRVIDATCPLVTKVHRQVSRHAAAGLPIVLIGHAGHDEVLGTMGEAPDAIHLVTSVADVDRLALPADGPVACVTQTTLGLDETREIVDALRRRFPGLVFPDRGDICYATQNRQDAVKDLVRRGAGFLLVVGSPNSSNSVRLCEVAERLGVPGRLISGPADLPWAEIDPHPILGLTAGASAPEHLVQGVATALAARGWPPREVVTLAEDVRFRLPPELDRPPAPRH